MVNKTLKPFMKHLHLFVGCLYMALSAGAYAALDVKVSPTQAQANEGQDATVNLTWAVTDGASVDALSSARVVINPSNGRELDSTPSTLRANGVSPAQVRETVRFGATDIDSWIAQGLSFVLVQREFTAAATGGRATASLRLNLAQSAPVVTPSTPTTTIPSTAPTPVTAPTPRSTDLGDLRRGGQGYLEIQSLRLEFENGNDLAITSQREDLKASLIVRNTGQGLLEGRWQVAAPGNSGEVPIFRTLSLVRKNVQQGQRISLVSPRLPTTQVGKFLVRFCAQVNRTELRDEVCSEPRLTALAAYEVQGSDIAGVQQISVSSPSGNQVSEEARFVWRTVPGSSTYQLQIFELYSQDSELPSSELTHESLEPTFVTGMVLPGNMVSTTLSELVKSKLVKGRKYLWRITAQNSFGQLVGISHERAFVYQ